jgi:hypothetical protein
MLNMWPLLLENLFIPSHAFQLCSSIYMQRRSSKRSILQINKYIA